MSEDLRNPELNALEAALTGLKPTSGSLDREQLMFRAGQESMRRPQWLWPATTAVLAFAIVMLGGLLAMRPTQREIVYVRIETPVPPAPLPYEEPSEPEPAPLPQALARAPLVLKGDYARLRDELLSGKVSQAAAPSYFAPDPTSLDQLLGLPPEALDHIGRSRLNRAFSRTGEPL